MAATTSAACWAPSHRGYPGFAVRPEIVDALAGAGYDSCSTASNHSLDDGTDGLVRTLDALDAAGIAHTGTYRSEAESGQPVIVEVGGVDVADVPDVDRMPAVATLLASPDIDLVLGHHAHVVQPFEQIDGEWVAYGLGNSIAEHSTRRFPTEDSVMARFTFTRGEDDRFTVTAAEAVPLQIVLEEDEVTVQPAGQETSARVAEVLDRRGAAAAGLQMVPG
ncbi:MAG: hypothetical protein JWR45_3591 [Blastococcus sp.]|nr:hypothetical protein [Blastococcus sp.]